ncbi:ABC transporter ATP-binding protein [Flexivirga caeni]|uniref:ABC transporter ATP-binding protein n=1 Tax=Flexivirga caeni TaxID=2294115 RepID=A0A3M9MIV8_9MICO|nr:ABC transporter ATP-binding protein [Flexivirga caeni]RNI24598.1 ABC transporter ATP-binding protein [Flexivirga caeni]
MVTDPSTAFIHLDDVTKSYRLGESTIQAADHLTLSIDEGSATAIVGRSGSGKSTLLHLIGGIDRPDSGTITVDGQNLGALTRNKLADYRSSIGFVFQQFHLLPALSALDNVLVPLVARRVDFDRHDAARQLLEAVGLHGREHAMPSQLSGGQQQRVAIARAMIHRPTLLIADEPTGNLDTTTATGVLDLLFQLQQDHGTTLVIATHDTTVAAQADDVIHIDSGHIDEQKNADARTP